MLIIKSTIDLKNILKAKKKQRKKLGLVPTMGSIHDGHLSLIKKAQENCDEVWVSIFINPTQFNDPKDFESYPKDFKSDINKIQFISKNINLFIPKSVNEIYHNDTSTDKFELGFINKVLEGKCRSGHFEGVATIVNKLFKIFDPNIVFFGEKDFQQTMIIRNLIDNFFPNIHLFICPTLRNKDGLALSSRNNLISQKSYGNCGIIFECLLYARENYLVTKYSDLIKIIKRKIELIDSFDLEYFEIRDEKTLKSFKQYEKGVCYRAFICVKVEGIRLIDNLLLS